MTGCRVTVRPTHGVTVACGLPAVDGLCAKHTADRDRVLAADAQRRRR